MEEPRLELIVERTLELMGRTKGALVRMYAEPGGGEQEPLCVVRTWSKRNIVRTLLEVEFNYGG